MSARFFGVPAMMLCSIVGCITTAHAGWWRTYGGEDYDAGNCVQITSDSNYVIVGNRDDSLWLLKVDTTSNELWSKIYGVGKGDWVEETATGDFIVASWTPSLMKTNTQGDTLWTKDYGMYSYCVQETSNGDYVVVGSDEHEEYLMFVKTDSEGNVLWTKTYGDGVNNFYSGLFVQEASDSGYIITGRHIMIEDEWYSTGLLLLKTNSQGDSTWSHTYGGLDYDEWNVGRCVRQTSDSGYVVTGNESTGLWLLKTNEQGDTAWTKTYRTPSGGTGFSIQETEKGEYIIVGATETFTMTPNHVADLTDLWLLKTNNQGDTLWSRIYGGDGYDAGKCVQQTSDSGYLIVGYTSSYGAGGSDIYFLKTDSLGLLSIGEEPIPKQAETWEVISSLGPQIELRYFSSSLGFRVSMFDASGCKVDELHSSNQSGVITWGIGYASGVYFIQAMDNRNQLKIAKVVLVR